MGTASLGCWRRPGGLERGGDELAGCRTCEERHCCSERRRWTLAAVRHRRAGVVGEEAVDEAAHLPRAHLQHLLLHLLEFLIDEALDFARMLILVGAATLQLDVFCKLTAGTKAQDAAINHMLDAAIICM